MPLGLLVELVCIRVTKEAILPFQIVPLAWTQLQQEPDRISVAKGLYQCHVAGLPQGHFGTGELLLSHRHFTSPVRSQWGWSRARLSLPAISNVVPVVPVGRHM